MDSVLLLTVLPWGLGNLLFQYSAAFSLSHEWGPPARARLELQEDLRLLSHCRHHILAPSTFGWWGHGLHGGRAST